MSEYTEIIKYYHERTKHKRYKFANSPKYLDWENEPKPFRKYTGTEKIKLPLFDPEDSPPFYRAIFRLEDIQPQSFDINSISKLLLFSLGISAWKEYRGVRWALRCNPSAGNLHPTEAYIIAPPQLLGNEKATLYHYVSEEHILEARAIDNNSNWDKFCKSVEQSNFLILGLTTVTWRMSWKYGERALRYCLLDIGHVISAVAYSARVMGWKTSILLTANWEYQKTLLGLNRPEFEDAEKETPQLVMLIYPHNINLEENAIFNFSIQIFDTWFGKPEKLSPNKVNWEIIDHTLTSLEKSHKEFLKKIAVRENEHFTEQEKKLSPLEEIPPSPNSFSLFRRRRSAHELNPTVSLPFPELGRLIKNLRYVKANIIKEVLKVELPTWVVIFVHSVNEIKSGIYIFPLHYDSEPQKLDKKFPSINVSEDNKIYLLKEGDFKHFATHILCGQDVGENSIALFGVFADIEKVVEKYGAFAYIFLHWEAGFIIHHLYLEAELLNLQGTGIGCFFDDEFTVNISNINGDIELYPLYYYALGKPIPDPRLKSYPPYPNAQYLTP